MDDARPRPEPPGGWKFYLGMFLVLAVIGIGGFLLSKFVDWNKVEDDDDSMDLVT